MFTVLILGAGPAGLIAAETALLHGANVIVYSRGDSAGQPIKSDLHGCQYLHAPVLSNMGSGEPIDYRLEGSAEGYREKVYGEAWSGPVSPDEFGTGEAHLGWDMRSAYDRLWACWHRKICVIPGELSGESVAAVLANPSLDLVVSTIPAPALCRAPLHVDQLTGHSFQSQSVWAIGESPFQKVPVPCKENAVVCNGTRDVGWYRKARCFGRTTVEYPWRDGKKPPIKGVVRVDKPTRTNCDCFLGDARYLRVGRFGKWEKGYLVHQVAEDVSRALGVSVS